MIEGIKLDIKGNELAEHAKRRAAYHKGRAEIYESKVQEIEQLQKSADEATQTVSKTSNASPTEGLEQSAKKHRAKEKFFAFAANHFLEGEIYRIKLEELEAFELAPSRY